MRSTSDGDQSPFGVRFDWGAHGADAIAAVADVALVVDVLSFTTTLTVALDCGIDVWPCPWDDEVAVSLASDNDAVLAVGRSGARPGEVSLSPRTVREARDVRRLVLPSPNGAALSHALAARTRVVGVSLRNAAAVARWLTDGHGTDGATVAVVAGGERWDDGSLRPAVEDLWGAGACVSALQSAGWTRLSPEARSAAAAFREVATELPAALHDTVSGRELAAMGFAYDVDIAAEVNASGAVPLLIDGRFGPA